MNTPASIAVIGAGLIGRRHIEHIDAEPQARLAAIVDPTDDARAFAAGKHVPYFPNIAALLAADRPDGMIVATPNQLHVAHGLEAIEAGIPVLIEKPISSDSASGERLVVAAEKAGVPLLVGHHRRHNPLIARAKAAIEAGELGRIVAVHAFFWLMKPDDYFETPWRRQKGAGPLLVNAIHDIDLLRHLCGDIVSVQAFQSRVIRQNPVDETTVMSLRFASGALGTVSITDCAVAPWSWEQTTGENPAYPNSGEICYFIGGTHGSLSVPRLDLWSNGERRGWRESFSVTREIAPAKDPLRLQIGHFCRVIKGEELPLISGLEGLKTLKVVEAVQLAADRGMAVDI